jgi:hypothetical protein
MAVNLIDACDLSLKEGMLTPLIKVWTTARPNQVAGRFRHCNLGQTSPPQTGDVSTTKKRETRS